MWYNLPSHSKVAGSGFHIPSSPHTEILLPSGRSPDWHLYTISELTVVLLNDSTVTPLEKEGVPQLTKQVNRVAPWLPSRYHFIISLTITPKFSWVRVPSPIRSTHCCHIPRWDKPWVTSKRDLSTLSCVLICPNRTISRERGITTVGYMKEGAPQSTNENRSRTKQSQSDGNVTGDSCASYLIDKFLDMNS